ncbi:RNA-binding S4 domain-containing protein [Deinococcus radiophilus]|uniref:RNA-binding S4 domain-containing protein n=1 Tax=Deinococcus radiophilus TaxID=32062 RepID=A0A3S0I6E0_9DEIO|nr:RNA-binding S4 domain-containing protein [Deinococcus radiophilus]RTR25813.1 RNA-binding S4 domain-containing protein [Deinococcus radiophilus]UFA50859.1 RNA-binding S4 domain-containing protein [Deinococcus radiophilus]
MTEEIRGPRDYGDQDTRDLQDILKIEGLVDTGGEAKFRIQNGEVRLNGEVETRRRRKVRCGDIIEIYDERIEVNW